MDTKVEVGLSSESSTRTQELIFLGRKKINDYWPAFASALKETRHLLDDSWTEDLLLAAALAGHAQLWMLAEDDEPKVLLITQFYKTRTTAVFQIFWAYGIELRPMFGLLSDAFDKFAAEHGAEKIEIQGRKGFERWLRPYGFNVDYVVFSRRVAAPKEN